VLGSVRQHGSQAEMTLALQRNGSAASGAQPQPLGALRQHGSQAELTLALHRTESPGVGSARGDSSGNAQPSNDMRRGESTDTTASTQSVGGRAVALSAMIGAGLAQPPSQAELFTITEGTHASDSDTAGGRRSSTGHEAPPPGLAASGLDLITGAAICDATAAASSASEAPVAVPSVADASATSAKESAYNSCELAEDPDIYAVSPDVDSLFTAMRRSSGTGPPPTLSTIKNMGSLTDSSDALTRKVHSAALELASSGPCTVAAEEVPLEDVPEGSAVDTVPSLPQFEHPGEKGARAARVKEVSPRSPQSVLEVCCMCHWFLCSASPSFVPHAVCSGVWGA
jgi:hypothetical protein